MSAQVAAPAPVSWPLCCPMTRRLHFHATSRGLAPVHTTPRLSRTGCSHTRMGPRRSRTRVCVCVCVRVRVCAGG